MFLLKPSAEICQSTFFLGNQNKFSIFETCWVVWWCESGEGICVWHGNSSHYFPMFLLFIAIYKSQVSDLLQVTPCPTLLRFIWFIVATTPPLFCSAFLRPTVITDITTPDKMVTPRCGLEIKGLRGKMRREAASFKRGRARRKGGKKKKRLWSKRKQCLDTEKKIKTNRNTSRGSVHEVLHTFTG